MSWKLFTLLVQAAGYTVAISAASILIGLALGLLVCGARLAPSRWLSWPAQVFISFFRGVPLLVLLLLVYNLLPALGVNVPSIVAAVISLSLSTAAYQAENLRGGFLSVPKGYIEAADMAGLTGLQQFARIRAPIALRLTLPSLANEAILILKSSSLISVVGVIELTRMAQNLASSTYEPLPLYAAAGLLYLAICSVVALGAGLGERAFRWGVPR